MQYKRPNLEYAKRDNLQRHENALYQSKDKLKQESKNWLFANVVSFTAKDTPTNLQQQIYLHMNSPQNTHTHAQQLGLNILEMSAYKTPKIFKITKPY